MEPGLGWRALYDLGADPRERVNLVEERPETARRLRGLLGAFLWQGRRTYGNPDHDRAWTPPPEPVSPPRDAAAREAPPAGR